MIKLNDEYINQVKSLYLLVKNKFPQSLILYGQENNIINDLSISLAEIIASNKSFLNFRDFHDDLLSAKVHSSPFIYKIEKIYLEDKKRFKKNIYRDDISALHSFFNTKDELNQKRICIIDKIDDLSIDASNSLLKLIEEPNQNSHFIILNSNKSKMLNTIRSRSFFVRFNKVGNNTFNENLEIDKKYIDSYRNLTNGSLFISKQFIKYEFHKIYDHFLSILENSNNIKSNTSSHYIKFLSDKFDKGSDISVFFEYLSLIIVKKTKIMCSKNNQNSVIKLLKIYNLVNKYKTLYQNLNLSHDDVIESIFYKIKYE